jgi:hypothetical protein
MGNQNKSDSQGLKGDEESPCNLSFFDSVKESSKKILGQRKSQDNIILIPFLLILFFAAVFGCI